MTCFLKNRRPKDIKYIVIHHGADGVARDRKDLLRKATMYDKWHSKRSWAKAWQTDGKFGYKYIEYHFLVAQNGDILQVQDIKFSRPHCTDCCAGENSGNKYGIAIEVPGNFEKVEPSKACLRTIVKLVGDFEKKYNLNLIIRGHKDMYRVYKNHKCLKYPRGTQCPGKNLYKYLVGGSKSKMVQWINYYEKTGKMPEELLDGKTCEERLKEKEIENKQLHDKLDKALKTIDSYKLQLLYCQKQSEEQIDKLNQKIKSQSKFIQKQHKEILELRGKVAECEKAKGIIKKFIEWLKSILSKNDS